MKRLKKIIIFMLIILCLFFTGSVDKPSQWELASKITIEEGYQIDDIGERQGETYSITVFRLSNQENYNDSYYEIIIRQGYEIKGVLRVEEKDLWGAFSDMERNVLEYDVNFDGTKDIIIFLGIDYGDRESYECYLMLDEELIYCPSFNMISNPAINPEDQEILSRKKLSESTIYGIHTVENNTFLMTERLTRVFEQTSDGDTISIWTDEVLINGEWVVRESFREDEMSEEEIRERPYGESSRWALYSDRWERLFGLFIKAIGRKLPWWF